MQVKYYYSYLYFCPLISHYFIYTGINGDEDDDRDYENDDDDDYAEDNERPDDVLPYSAPVSVPAVVDDNNNINNSNHLNQPSIVPALSTSSNNPPTFPTLTSDGNNAQRQLKRKADDSYYYGDNKSKNSRNNPRGKTSSAINNLKIILKIVLHLFNLFVVNLLFKREKEP